MARFDFGGTLADFVVTSHRLGTLDTLALSAATLTMWSAQSGGTRYTDLVLNGSAVSSIAVGADGQVPKFQGPDAVTEMWVDGGGTRIRLVTLQGAPGPAGKDGVSGKDGLPGVNAVPADNAVAGYVAGPSQTATALSASYVPASQASGGNLKVGYSGNSIDAGSAACAVIGGGTLTNENRLLGVNNYRTILGGYDQQVGGGIAAGSIASQHARVLNPADPTNPDGAVSPNHSYAIAGSYHSITKGAYNTAIGGTAATISSSQGGSTLGGLSLTVSGANASAIGGATNTVEGAGATVLGGSGSAAYSSAAVVAGINLIAGKTGTTQGESVALVGGRDSQFGVVASARYSGALAGRDHRSDVEYTAFLAGRAAKAMFPGFAHRAMGSFVTQGDAQAADGTLHNSTTDATPTLLYTDGTTAGFLTIPANTLWTVELVVSAFRTDVVSAADCASFKLSASVFRGASGASTSLIGTPEVTRMRGTTASTWDVTLAPSTGTTGRLSVTATGEAGKTIHWVADLKIVQVQ